MKNLKVNWKKVIALATTITLVGTGASLIKKKINSTDGSKENKIGYENFKYLGFDAFVPLFNDVRENNFVVLDVGDHDSVKVHFQDAKIKYCNDKDIALGLMISTDSITEDGIYDDVEYVKGILSNYDVHYPVYLNIDHIISNDDLNIEMKTKLIKNFLEKCSANNIYVGLYGTDTNLCRVKKYCKISDYDAFLVMDKKDIEYKGNYNVYKDLQGNIQSKDNLERVITDKDLNNSNNYVNDGAYVFSKDDDLIDISLKYGMSVNELLDFNEIDKSDVHEGTVLRIPMVIDKVAPNVTNEYKKVETPLKGCDISYAQESSPDWEQLKDNFDFIILRCSHGVNMDSYFEVNALNCNTNNIPIGVYCYNDFNKNNCENIDDFVENQKRQVKFALQTLNNKKIDYPVYLDIEGDITNNLDKKHVKKMLKIWKKHVEVAGYIPGVYCNQSDFKYLQNCVSYDLSDKFEIWIAGGDQYMSEKYDKIEFAEVVPSSVFENDYGATIAQSTNVAVNAGAYDTRGHLDIDYSVVDYTQKISNVDDKSNNQFQIKEFDRYDYPLIGSAVGIGLFGIGGAFGGIKLRSNKKKKIKTKSF